ncbi:MAG: class I SAM-dependent methyltransferase [Actinobacteria bacterium]|nr:class I SAM-dependent methyltransferase [Actinomycetota bacterium]
MDEAARWGAKRMVAEGYDRIGHRYLSAFSDDAANVRTVYLHKLFALLDHASFVLELGCGAGIPVTRSLAENHQVVGVDMSIGQLRLARTFVPGASLMQADMSALHFAPGSFDAVTAFYALTHVPREEHARLLEGICSWLRPGGAFLATMGCGDDPGSVEDGWLGVPMFFSHYGAETNQQLVREAGFVLVEADIVTETEHEDEEVSFLWVVAQKPE